MPDLTLVLVPGLGLAEPVYADFAAALGAVDVRLVALPGCGLRAPRGTRLTPDALAAAVQAEAGRLGLRRYALLGHSSSCQVVAEVAAADAGRVTAVVLVGPTTDRRAATWPRLAGRWLATAVHEEPGQAPLLARVYARTGLVSMARAMDASRRHDLRPALARTSAPVLVVRGRHDRIAPQDWSDAVAAAGRGRRVGLPMGAHMVPVTHPRPLAALVGPWLAAVAVGTGAPPAG